MEKNRTEVRAKDLLKTTKVFGNATLAGQFTFVNGNIRPSLVTRNATEWRVHEERTIDLDLESKVTITGDTSEAPPRNTL